MKPLATNGARRLREKLAALETLINLNDGIEDGGQGITCADWRDAHEVLSKAKGGNAQE